MNSNSNFISIPKWAVYWLIIPIALVALFIYLWFIVQHSGTREKAREIAYTWWDVWFTLVNAFIAALVAYLMGKSLLAKSDSDDRLKELQCNVLTPLRADIFANK